jgi:hypothetical protein
MNTGPLNKRMTRLEIMNYGIPPEYMTKVKAQKGTRDLVIELKPAKEK